jgi:hypothetical protein
MITDTNVVLHLLDPRYPGSEEVLAAFSTLCGTHTATANEIVFAEISASFENSAAVARQFEMLRIEIVRLTLDECFRAGVAFREYRRNGGPRTTLLPDFLIGAQAAVRGWPILTRDTKRFASYFPEVELLDPLASDND